MKQKNRTRRQSLVSKLRNFLKAPWALKTGFFLLRMLEVLRQWVD